MEHAGHGDLLEFIKLRGAIPEEKAKVMFSQLAHAINYLHNRFIVHR
jgi:serine kinase